MAARSSRKSPLFKLPPELRNFIYELVLQGPRMTLLIPFRLPALLQVNKQVRSEASPIFCAQNEFFVSLTTASLKPFSQCLVALGEEGTNATVCLTISLDLDAEMELYRLSKFGGAGVMNYPHWMWSDVPRLIKKAGVRPEVVQIAQPLAIHWTQDATTYANRWVATMKDELPGSSVEEHTEET